MNAFGSVCCWVVLDVVVEHVFVFFLLAETFLCRVSSFVF